MGATLRCPLPKPSDDHIPAINLEEASKVHLLTDKNNPPQIPVSVHDAALPAPFDRGKDAKAAWQKTDLAISRDKVLAAFSSLVAATGGPTRMES
ncbi:hypothetical protein Slin15195_G052020 [Septoria linicola]|uniref:Uncharacterized protein n=1 Tax=Septoria linicola TaxID=215465 RepID=A0A9Q9ATJ8_9PEZI|nr:hypothetical protein Slin14017_G127530 [Septoria linicola]USW51883.1 hypothetical protein Slin15195_G052020 [Septoria linicola]